MRFTATLQNFWLPLMGGVVMAIPVLFLGGRPAGAELPPAPAVAPRMGPGCGPFVESFASMRAEAERIASLAAAAEAPLEDDLAGSSALAETWREIASAARALDAWMWEARSDGAPLSLREAAVVSVATPLTSDIRTWSAAVAGDLASPPSELDAALMIGRMQAVEQAAATVARSLGPLAECAAPQELTYVPAAADCETLDPEVQQALAGPCRY